MAERYGFLNQGVVERVDGVASPKGITDQPGREGGKGGKSENDCTGDRLEVAALFHRHFFAGRAAAPTG